VALNSVASRLLVLTLFGLVSLAGCTSYPEITGNQGSGQNPNPPPSKTDGSTPPVFGLDSGTKKPPSCDGSCTPTPVDVCGDGAVTGSEQCDDGNSKPGDGCSGLCQIEPGYRCPTPGQPCVYSVQMTCGNGVIEGTEICDDGNTKSGDGCSGDCAAIEPGYTCNVAGTPCVPTTEQPVCGNGKLETGEQCDDGNTSKDASAPDGCTADCKLEPGWSCPKPGAACVPLAYCGDGIVQTSLSETCDDGNAVPGDGCSGLCQTEPGYLCSTPGQPCVNQWVCGNGKVDPGESCDDGNTTGGDGCRANCTVEPGWTCPKAADGTGGACKQVQNVCGDAILSSTEECDDGNTAPNDGCDATCHIEPGWTCPTPGSPCTKTAYCGNGIVDLALGEKCDDGNTASGDGCSGACQIEQGYACPTPGSPCVSTVKCGDGKIGGSEQCDDGNTTSNDGCSATCTLEAGWQCPVPGAHCVGKCGDGKVVWLEQCDDGNTKSNDGCSSACKLESGYACTTGSPSKCHVTVCGDGTKEGFEQCDDGNRIPYDGCSPSCTVEPKCTGGQCTAVCGDGLKFPQEQCDDGNTMSGDGCSATCTLEKGYTCPVVTLSPPSQLAIPILYRDFRYRGTTNGHPDFQWNIGTATGLVQSTLDADGLPEFASSTGSGGTQLITNADSFYWWYHDTSNVMDAGSATNPYEKLVYLDAGGNPTTLTLTQIASGAYQFNNQSFFPVDGLGWNASGTPQVDTADDGLKHNFSFTSELRYQFTYQGGEVLDFTGDDDVWVFINGRLAVDLGGVHGAKNGSITLDATAATKLGLVKGDMYEIALFQAERHTTASTYKLTLTGFTHAISQCQPICGDGIVTPQEVCDDGKNTGAYGGCMPGCQAFGPYCGDKIVQTPPEQCDDGTNLGSYGQAKACAPGCTFAPYCGDGVVSNGEQCDEGAGNGTGYGHCTSACTLGQRCGDGIVNGPEQCDTGIDNGSSGSPCSATCTLKCGNGVLDPGEQCDDGAAANVGGYGKCNPDCTLGPRCGDGVKTPPETCDDGKNDGTYGTCTSTCQLAGYCGDGILQNPPESCDLGGKNSATAYGKTQCTNRCTQAPYCGDKAVDGAFGETCDDGVNSGKPGSCTTDCKSNVPLSSCGDGKVEPPEACDDGTNNGTVASTCDANCRRKCGNGLKDPGEQCDNGVNNGSYGTCRSDCTLAGYCGDGVVNGPETCDNGGHNVSVATAYGPGICTTACTPAPFCGDGRIQSPYEQCDGGPGCGGDCQLLGPQ
jgi:fibro-slime domain-containing protein